MVVISKWGENLYRDTRHKHNWQTISRYRDGATIYFHVCLEHKGKEGKIKPVVKAFDMTKLKSPSGE